MDILMTKSLPREQLIKWLRQALAERPKSAHELTEAALRAGHNATTLRRAKKACGVSSVKLGAQWYWRLPQPNTEI